MKALPHYIYKKSNQIIMVLFVPLFCMAFIFMYHPMDFALIEESNNFDLPFSTDTSWHILVCIMVLIGMAVAALSRWLMKFYSTRHTVTYNSYILWIVAEILAMTAVYTAISSFMNVKPFFVIFETVFFKVVRILLIPYIMSYVYFIWQEKSHQLKLIKSSMEGEEVVAQRAYIQLHDERDKMQLSIRRENLLMLISSDNYVTVWYLNNNVPKQTMIRNNLKRISQYLEDTNVKRCHRSYMVNMDHVKLLRREKDGIFIELGIDGVPVVPISKTYSDSISQWLVNRSSKE